jgi:hypothetical protein
MWFSIASPRQTFTTQGGTMAKYLFAYHGGSMADTEEERNAQMAKWGQWFQELGAAVVEPGAPVKSSRTVSNGGSVSDGGGANPVNGYTVIEADSFDAATDRAKGCPILSTGGSVEVAETIEM